MATTIENRIVGEGEESPSSLAANPRNWRVHSATQEKALNSVLEDVGWVQRVIVNRRTGFIIDGHLRVALAEKRGETQVPVSYVDLDENEEATILATFDPIGAMATTDKDTLADLLNIIESGSNDVAELVSKLAEDYGIIPPDFEPAGEDEQGKLDEKKKVQCPECGHEFAP